MKIIVFGDIHNDLHSIKKILDADKADLIVISGDFTRFGGTEEVKKIIDFVKNYNENILAQLGNMDKAETDEYLTRLKINLNGTGYILNDSTGIFGIGGSNPSPFNTPTEYSEEQLARIAANGYEKIKNQKIKIMISHAPPYNTKTDMVSSGGHVGSKAIRNFIEKNRIDLCVCGHIHESKNYDIIGETKLINPGTSNNGYVLITIMDNKISAELKSFN